MTNLTFSRNFRLKVNNYIRQESLKRVLEGDGNRISTDFTIAKILSNVDFVTRERVWNLFEIISNFLCLIFGVGLLMYYHWSYAVLASLFAIVLSFLPILFKNKYNEYQKKITEIDNNYKGEMGSLINQMNSMYLISKMNVVNNIAAKLTLEKNKILIKFIKNDDYFFT